MDDLISRQAAIEILEEIKDLDYENYVHRQFSILSESQWDAVIANFKKLINKAQPEQKTATFYVDNEGYVRCSACNEHESRMWYFNFCPNCGAKMEGVK